jgi:hypothetical protein
MALGDTQRSLLDVDGTEKSPSTYCSMTILILIRVIRFRLRCNTDKVRCCNRDNAGHLGKQLRCMVSVSR